MDVHALAHRGLWRGEKEQNTLRSLAVAWTSSIGVETDVRDCGGKLVVSHDPPNDSALLLDEVFSEYAAGEETATLALNIKSDGLAPQLEELLRRYRLRNYFVFDTSVPDSRCYISRGLRFFSRQSEYEPRVAFYAECQGVWLDCFERDWFTEDTIRGHLTRGKDVCVVSPELHGRSYEAVWEMLRKIEIKNSPKLFVCTDHPEEFTTSRKA